MLRHLAYVSRTADDLAPGEVTRIIRVSRRRNPELRITGALVFAGNGFAQWLEGRPEVVQPLWEAIRRDGRHAGIVVLVDQHDREVAHFSDWRAGFPSDTDIALQFEALRLAGRQLDPAEEVAFHSLLQRCDLS